MPTDPAKYVDTRDPTPGRLRTAAWLQYLIEHLDVAVPATTAGNACAPATVASHAKHIRVGVNLSHEAAAILHQLVPWIAADGADCAGDPADPLGACSRVPTEQQLVDAERCCPGSRAAFDTARGVLDACGFDDPDVGWAALERIADGVEDAGERIAGGNDGDNRAPPAMNLRERLAAVEATNPDRSPRPGAVIDAIVLRACGPRDDAARVDELTALAIFSAELAAGRGVSVAAYGGQHNLVVRAIRTHRADLASVNGLLAALAVCRLDRILGAGSFWANYLLAGVAIAAPDTVREIGRRFHGDTWQTWLDNMLALPVVSRFGKKEDDAFEHLRDAMRLTSSRNPIVLGKRMRVTSRVN